MEVQAERYFLMMMHMHFLCFVAAGRMLHLRPKKGRLLLACLLSSLHSLLALLPEWPLNSSLATALVLFLSAIVSFGRDGPMACLPLGIGGFCYGGLCAFLTDRGGGPMACLLCCTLVCLLLRPRSAALHAALQITHHGRRCRLPALHDTGNTLRYAPLALPVIVCSERQLRPLLPEGFSAADIGTLPEGFFLLTASTVHGRKLMMAFRPDSLLLLPEKRPLSALIAITPEKLPHALLPRTIQPKEDSSPWRKNIRPGKAFPPSVNG